MSEDGALLKLEETEDGKVVELSLDAGKGQVLSRKVIEQLDQAFTKLKDERRVRALILTAEGNDFSFGASVPEHVPGEVETMLPAFSRLFRTIASSGLPICAAVRGRCFGGGFELALAAHHIIVADDAKLGVPEVTLGVFPPVAAAILPWRVRQPVADRLVMTGEVIDGKTAADLGIADEWPCQWTCAGVHRGASVAGFRGGPAPPRRCARTRPPPPSHRCSRRT